MLNLDKEYQEPIGNISLFAARQNVVIMLPRIQTLEAAKIARKP